MAGAKIRTNYIKLSLTNEEYDNLVEYSEAVNKTISGAVRDLIDLATDIGVLYGVAKENYLKVRKVDPKLIETEQHFLTIMKDLPFKTQMDVYSYISKLDRLAPFSSEWKTVNKKVLKK